MLLDDVVEEISTVLAEAPLSVGVVVAAVAVLAAVLVARRVVTS